MGVKVLGWVEQQPQHPRRIAAPVHRVVTPVSKLPSLALMRAAPGYDCLKMCDVIAADVACHNLALNKVIDTEVRVRGGLTFELNATEKYARPKASQCRMSPFAGIPCVSI